MVYKDKCTECYMIMTCKEWISSQESASMLLKLLN